MMSTNGAVRQLFSDFLEGGGGSEEASVFA